MSNEWTQRKGNRRRGFTLVELAVASALVAVGLLAVFALLRRGIDTEGASEEEIRETLFVETFDATLRAAADHASATGTWTEFWTAFANGSTNLPLPGASSASAPEHPDGARTLDAASPVPFLVGGDPQSWHAALFAGWPRESGGGNAVSNVVWYTLETTPYDDIARIQLHVVSGRPRESYRTAFTLIPNQSGRAFLRPSRRDAPEGNDDE